MLSFLCLRRTGFFLVVCGLGSLLTGCSSSSVVPVPSSQPAPPKPVWAAAWGNAPENSFTPSVAEQTFRMPFRPTLSGTMERLHFSNFFGTTPITIGAARLSVNMEGTPAIDPGHDVAITFNGASSVTIPAGAIITSDPVSLTYDFGQTLAVTMYVKGTFPSLTFHNSTVTTTYDTPPNAGDTTTDTAGTSFSVVDQRWYLLSGMDVYGLYQGTVVLFGSSSIDGFNSNLGDTNAYPTANVAVPGQDDDRPSDWLARQLHAAGYQLGVLNAGVLADPAGPNTSATPANGIQDGIDRFNRDVLQQTNVKAVVIYLGSVDIRSADCTSAPAIENSLSQIIAMAAAGGIRVVIGTLPPAAFCSTPGSPNFGPIPSPSDPYGGEGNPPTNGGMVQRNLVNAWIRSTAANLPGVVGVADFDKAMADPAHPDFLLPNLNSGDNVHPDGPGYGVQSSAVPLNVLLAPTNQ